MIKDPEAWKRLGAAVRNARLRQGLSQKVLAQQAGVSVPAVQAVEAGTVPKSRMPQTLPRITAALDWPAGMEDRILAGEAEPGAETSVQHIVDERRVGGIITHAIIHHMDGATAAEIRAATEAALEALRKEGLI